MSKDQQNKLNFFSVFAGSTNNVIKSVVLGKVDAGAVFVTELEMEPREVRDELRPLVRTEKVPPHPLCAHPRVPRPVQEAVKKATLAFAETQEGSEILKRVRLPSPVEADFEKDYRPLETIDIKGLSNWGE